jgi:hypothetical protein
MLVELINSAKLISFPGPMHIVCEYKPIYGTNPALQLAFVVFILVLMESSYYLC